MNNTEGMTEGGGGRDGVLGRGYLRHCCWGEDPTACCYLSDSEITVKQLPMNSDEIVCMGGMWK